MRRDLGPNNGGWTVTEQSRFKGLIFLLVTFAYFYWYCYSSALKRTSVPLLYTEKVVLCVFETSCFADNSFGECYFYLLIKWRMTLRLRFFVKGEFA
jgi:hypothetical protein